MESEIQNQFTAYLRKALARQRWRSQAKIAQQEYYEQPLLNCECCALLDQSPTYDVIPLVHTMLTERERNEAPVTGCFNHSAACPARIHCDCGGFLNFC